MIVVDTDVLAYYLIRGARTDQAQGLKRLDPDWRAPQLWRAELISVVNKHFRAGLINLSRAHGILRSALDLYGAIDMAVDLNEVFSLAAETGATTHDAHFLALARRCGVPLITGEHRHPGSVQGLAVNLEEFLRLHG